MKNHHEAIAASSNDSGELVLQDYLTRLDSLTTEMTSKEVTDSPAFQRLLNEPLLYVAASQSSNRAHFERINKLLSSFTGIMLLHKLTMKGFRIFYEHSDPELAYQIYKTPRPFLSDAAKMPPLFLLYAEKHSFQFFKELCNPVNTNAGVLTHLNQYFFMINFFCSFLKDRSIKKSLFKGQLQIFFSLFTNNKNLIKTGHCYLIASGNLLNKKRYPFDIAGEKIV